MSDDRTVSASLLCDVVSLTSAEVQLHSIVSCIAKADEASTSYGKMAAWQIQGARDAPASESDLHNALPGDDQGGLALALVGVGIELLRVAHGAGAGVPQLAQRSRVCASRVPASALGSCSPVNGTIYSLCPP